MKKILKVLVVDDEPISRDSIVYMIEKNLPELEVADTCRSGKDAIEKNYYHKPDIIIMDINMPGINGLDAMKRIREVNKDVCFIVVSAFDYFDYAVEAVAIGVQEYILKPVKKQKFVETLKKVMLLAEQKRNSMMRELEHQEKLEMMLPVLETSFINSVCMYGKSTDELKDYYELFESNAPSGYIAILEMKESKIFTDRRVYDAEHVKGERRHSKDNSVYKECRDIIKSVCDCIVGPLMSKRIVLYIHDIEKENMHEQKETAKALVEKMLDRLSVIQDDIYIGLGSFCKELDDIKKSYNEAITALRYVIRSKKSTKVMHIDDVENEKSDKKAENNYEQSFDLEVCVPLADDDTSMAQMGFERLYQRMCTDKNFNFGTIKNIIIGFVVELNKKCYSSMTDYCDIIGEILKCSAEKELYDIMIRYIGSLVSQVTVDKQRKAATIVNIIDKYIEEHYKEEIMLEDVARLVNFSSYYLSRFYKNETGINFSDKIMHVRVGKAKELFLNSEGNVKDVTYMVGYSDPNYFSKIFKKVTGYTVSEFKKANGL